jgi:NADH-quinone oxidoreductase subunit D
VDAAALTYSRTVTVPPASEDARHHDGEHQLSVGVGAVAATGSQHEVALSLGPHHPSSHGGLRLRLTLDGDRLVACEPDIGFLHRGAEKLFEARDYRQLLVLANRHDWLSAFSSELGVVLVVERLLGMEVPPRATWARTLLAELNRVLSHLAFLGTMPVGSRRELAERESFSARETVQAVMEEATGGRMHFMFNRVGGLREDLPERWLDHVDASVADVRDRVAALGELVLDDDELQQATRGVGVLRAADVEAYGVSGPAARAAGVDLDLRRDDPYLAYAELADVLEVPLRRDGDCLARLEVLHAQLLVSLELVSACTARLRDLDPGPVNVSLPKRLRPAEGSTYAWTENPLGINGYYLVSRGERTPWRLKLRSASFNNVAALPRLLEGARLVDLTAVLASMFFVVGDIDK